MTNDTISIETRRERASAALKEYVESKQERFENSSDEAVDLITDLLHLSVEIDDEGSNAISGIIHMARHNFEVEHVEDDPAKRADAIEKAIRERSKFARAFANMQKLPLRCAAILPSSKRPIFIDRGLDGYTTAPKDLDVSEHNEILGITNAQVEAMQVGSMFGWDVPGADPDIYDKQVRMGVDMLPVSAREVADQFVAAFEGGSTHWLNKARYVGPDVPRNNNWYDDETLINERFLMEVEYDPTTKTDTGKKVVTFLDIKNGLDIMTNKHASHFADMKEENGDAITADVLMQCIVLGEVVFG